MLPTMTCSQPVNPFWARPGSDPGLLLALCSQGAICGAGDKPGMQGFVQGIFLSTALYFQPFLKVSVCDIEYSQFCSTISSVVSRMFHRSHAEMVSSGGFAHALASSF